jgi:DNA mismatch endonuclease, patch repair protein
MPDCFDPQKRSEIMAQIKSSGSKPEERLGVLLRKWLPNCLIRPNDPDLPGKPDFHLVDLRIAVFLDGCFFHGCPLHYRAPAQNGEYWAAKVARNKVRDKVVTTELKSLGYMVLRVWEHELRTPAMVGRERIRRRLRRKESAALAVPPVLLAAESRAAYGLDQAEGDG